LYLPSLEVLIKRYLIFLELSSNLFLDLQHQFRKPCQKKGALVIND
jgi:hypothetical protein